MVLNGPVIFQTGTNQWLCMLQPTTITPIPVSEGQTVFKLTIFEKDALVSNYFSGIVQRGNTTPLITFGNSGITLRTDTPLPTTGVAGNLNFFIRTDCMYLNNLTATSGKFIVLFEGLS